MFSLCTKSVEDIYVELSNQIGKFFITGSGTYTWRSNIGIDQSSYYTTEEIISNQVQMPNTETFQGRSGYRSEFLIAEAIVTRMNTLGGFDMRRNDGPRQGYGPMPPKRLVWWRCVWRLTRVRRRA